MLSLGQSGRIASSCFREAAFPGRPRRSGHRDVLAPFLHFPHLTFPYFPYSVIGSLTNSMVSDRHDQRAHSDLQNDAGLQKLTSAAYVTQTEESTGRTTSKGSVSKPKTGRHQSHKKIYHEPTCDQCYRRKIRCLRVPPDSEDCSTCMTSNRKCTWDRWVNSGGISGMQTRSNSLGK